MKGLPTNFTRIRDIRAGPDAVSFAGTIIASKGIKPTRGADNSLEVTVQDEFDADDASIGATSSIILRYFCSPEDFQDDPNVGDFVLVRRAKAMLWNDKLTASTHRVHSTDLLIFSSKSVPIGLAGQAVPNLDVKTLIYKANSTAQPPNESERRVVLEQKAASAPRVKDIQNQDSNYTPGRPKRLKLIKDLEIGKYHDLHAEVVKLWDKDLAWTDIFVTDYTANRDLFWYEEPEGGAGDWSGWQGPYGQLTLAVRLFGINSVWARDNVHVGQHVLLRNVHIKFSNNGKLEGALHEDRRYPDQNDIRRLIDQAAVAELKKRKAEYQKKHQVSVVKNDQQKPSTRSLAKKGQEKRERKQMKRLQRELEQNEAQEIEFVQSGINTDSEPTTSLELPQLIALSSRPRPRHQALYSR
jgi:protection of telomeres protein 1